MKSNLTLILAALLIVACGGKDKGPSSSSPAEPDKEILPTVSDEQIRISETSGGVEISRGSGATETLTVLSGAKILVRSAEFVVIEKPNKDRFLYNKKNQLGQTCPRSCDVLISDKFAIIHRISAPSTIFDPDGNAVARIVNAGRGKFKVSDSFVAFVARKRMKLFRAGSQAPLSQCKNERCEVELNSAFAFVHYDSGRINLFNSRGVKVMDARMPEGVDANLSKTFAHIKPSQGGLLFHVNKGKNAVFNCMAVDCKIEVTDGFAAITSEVGHVKVLNSNAATVFETVTREGVDVNLSNVFAAITTESSLRLYYHNQKAEIFSCAQASCEADVSDNMAQVVGITRTSAFNKFGEKIR